jgi:hypothetical protein
MNSFVVVSTPLPHSLHSIYCGIVTFTRASTTSTVALLFPPMPPQHLLWYSPNPKASRKIWCSLHHSLRSLCYEIPGITESICFYSTVIYGAASAPSERVPELDSPYVQ